MTLERQNELKRRIDERFDQFSLDDLNSADSGALTFGIAFPDLAIRDREFAEQYFNQKIEELRHGLRQSEPPDPDTEPQ